ncbi:MAG TPA: serine protease [Candidatus Campbellbacteria bacterium]|nr:serine protease [Candidatus Campbellbacteria bacterium]
MFLSKIAIRLFLSLLFLLAIGAGVAPVNIAPGVPASIPTPLSTSEAGVAHTQAVIVPTADSATHSSPSPAVPSSASPTQAVPAVPKTDSKQKTPPKVFAPLPNYFISSAGMAEKKINIETIVMVRCAFRSQYFASSSQPWNEEKFRVGSGIIISPRGYILTAEHAVVKDSAPDKTGRKWKREDCHIVQTDQKQTPIVSVGYWGQADSPRFKKASIIFEPTEEEYAASAGLDFAILKIETDSNTPFVLLEPKLVDFREGAGAPILTIGYPGKISAVPQTLERFDAKFQKITYFENSPCDGTVKPCGLRYQATRSLSEYLNDFWKKTSLGVITPYFRKGFSGAPAFFKGNLIGIVTHGKSGDDPSVAGIQVNKPDMEDILTSYDISETLKKNNLSF